MPFDRRTASDWLLPFIFVATGCRQATRPVGIARWPSRYRSDNAAGRIRRGRGAVPTFTRLRQASLPEGQSLPHTGAILPESPLISRVRLLTTRATGTGFRNR